MQTLRRPKPRWPISVLKLKPSVRINDFVGSVFVSKRLIAMKTYYFMKVVAFGAAIFLEELRLESAKPNTRSRSEMNIEQH